MIIILTVEDEALISEFLCTVLEDAGHQVVTSSTADEALAILESRHDVQLLITDVTMPGSMDGLALARMVRNKWPSVKIFIASGKPQPVGNQMPAQSRFFAKPYQPQAILEAIRRLEEPFGKATSVRSNTETGRIEAPLDGCEAAR
jgi:two-component system, response regulator PdtaR